MRLPLTDIAYEDGRSSINANAESPERNLYSDTLESGEVATTHIFCQRRDQSTYFKSVEVSVATGEWLGPTGSLARQPNCFLPEKPDFVQRLAGRPVERISFREPGFCSEAREPASRADFVQRGRLSFRGSVAGQPIGLR